MFTPERHNAIKRIVREQRRVRFATLQRLIKVSPATLRRDLAELEENGTVIRVHGGVLDPVYVRTEVPFDERVVRNGRAKKAMALVAAELVPAGTTVLVDAGTSCLEVGKILLARKDVRLITNSVALVQTGIRGEAAIVCLGGELRKVSGALTGATALGALDKIHADIGFVGASGLDWEGCSTTELTEAEMKKAIIARATRKILVADSDKWQNPSTVRFAGWEDLDDLVTDKMPDSDQIKRLQAAKLKIHAA